MLRNCACLVIANMVDATQLCLSCHCTHGGCYATHFVLSLHTWWMLRNCACLVIAHMVDATQLTLSLSGALQNAILQASACPPSSKADRYAVPRSDMETIEKIHAERASQPRPNHQTWQPSFGGICLVVFVQNERAAEVAWSTGQIGPKSKQCYKIEKKNVFFSAEAFNTHEFLCVFFFEDTNPWKKWDEINIWTNKPYMEFNTLAAFRASSTKCHVNIAQGRNHGRNLVFIPEMTS